MTSSINENFNALPLIIKHTEQYKFCMQKASLNLISMIKLPIVFVLCYCVEKMKSLINMIKIKQ